MSADLRAADSEGGPPKKSVRQEIRAARGADDEALLRGLGQRVRQKRRLKNLTIAQLAATVGLDPAYVGELERGRANVSVLTLAQIGRVLGVGPSFFLQE